MIPHVPEFEVALAANDFEAIENLWTDLLGTYGESPGVFLALADKLAKKKEKRRAASLLSVALTALKDAENSEGAYDIALAIAEYNPNEPGLWDELVTLIPEALKGFPEIEGILAEGRARFEGQVKPFLEYVQLFTQFRPGDFVYHASGWGVGKVTAAVPSAKKLTIDFYKTEPDDTGGERYVVGKAGHQFALEVATRVLSKLDPEHIWAWKVERMDELREQCQKDPIHVLRRVLVCDKNPATQRDVKNHLVPDVLSPKAWSRFLTKLKRAAGKDPLIRVGQGQNPTFTLLSREETFEERALSTFRKPIGWAARIELSREALIRSQRESIELDILRVAAAHWTERVSRDETVHLPKTLGAICWLREAAAAHADIVPEAPDVPAGWLDAIGRERFVALLADMPVAYQKELLERASEWTGEQYQALLTECFLSPSASLWDESMRICNERHILKAYDDAFELLGANPERAPDSFVWCVRQFQANAAKDEEHDLVRYQLFEKLLALANRMQHLVDRGQKEFKASISRIKAALIEKRYGLLAALIKSISAGQAAQLFHLLNQCRGIGDNLRGALRQRLESAFGELSGTSEDEVGVTIDKKFIYVTEGGLAKHRRTLDRLMTEELPEIAKAIGEALAMGDISENAELDAAREREAQLKHRARQMREELDRVRLIEPAEVPTDVISLGARVTLLNVESGETLTYTIVGPWDVDLERNHISYRTRIAESLIGKTVGDEAKIAQTSRTLHVRVQEIENGLAEFIEAQD